MRNILLICALLFTSGSQALPTLPRQAATPPAPIASYVVDPRRQQLRFYWKDEHGRRFGSLGQLRAWLAARHEQLLFATNGGMYAPGGAPQGLFIQQRATLTPLDTTRGPGNFYLQPNGVFYLTTAGQPAICPTSQFRPSPAIAYATQSGPLLLHHGQLHPAFRAHSTNQVVRNGVGLLPDGRVVFAISREKINFYDFASYFQRLGCREALYLDGYVSRLYAPAQGYQQTDGDFGVILGVTVPLPR